MTRTLEVVYEDEVLKPLVPVEGVQEHERLRVILCPRPDRSGLRKLVGTLTHEEAEEMMKVIDAEFGRIEGEW